MITEVWLKDFLDEVKGIHTELRKFNNTYRAINTATEDGDESRDEEIEL